MTESVFRSERLTPEAFEALASAHPGVVIPLEQTPQWAAFERSLAPGKRGKVVLRVRD